MATPGPATPVTEIARRIRAGEVTSRGVLESCISRVEQVNPALNAVVAFRYEEARREADAADRRLAEEGPDDLPPLHGVPCTIKECFALRGMPNSSGLRSRENIIALRDATAVARLRAAGAVPMGVTNTSELCMWMESNNKLYGRTNNPYDLRRTVGGSSGGEGAIVGAGASPFGLGSDIGGSIRMPAFFNGIFGHKATGGLVPGTGQHPMAENEARRYLSTGPLCRRAEDLMPLLRILAGPDGSDGGCEPMELGDPSEVRLDGLRVLDVSPGGAVTPDLLAAQRRAAAALAERGASVERVRFDGLGRSLEIWSAMLGVAGDTPYQTLLENGLPLKLRRELPLALARRSDFTTPSLMLCLIERFNALMTGRNREMAALGKALREEIEVALGEEGVLLYAPHARPAPLHREAILKPLGWVFTAVFNVLELPITQVPLGLNAAGLPLGVQVGARRGQDHRTIAVAQALEQACGGWVQPPV